MRWVGKSRKTAMPGSMVVLEHMNPVGLFLPLKVSPVLATRCSVTVRATLLALLVSLIEDFVINASLTPLVVNEAIDDVWSCGTESVELAFAEGFASIGSDEVLTEKKLFILLLLLLLLLSLLLLLLLLLK